MYNKLALITGFPEFTSETDTLDTTRFLLSVLSDSLKSVINNIYMSNNVLERTDSITTKNGQELYGVEGIIRQVQIVDKSGKSRHLPYLDNFNANKENSPEAMKTGAPVGYCISKGYLRLVPCPDAPYNLKVTVSTTDLVWANDDTSRTSIESVDDTVMADNRFCMLVVLRAAMVVFQRAQNANFNVYAELFSDELRDYIEHDFKTFEANRFFDRRAGHYSPERGLLGD